MKNTNILTEFTVGSRLFKLDTESSDTDKIVVYVDYESRLFPSAKLNFLEVDQESNSEVSHVELGEFIKGILIRPNLKEVEMLVAVLDSDVTLSSPTWKVMAALESNLLSRPEALRDMYQREINRRYNKLWHREHNLSGKNYNKDVELDVKFAAHLYRVLISAQHYLIYGVVKTDFSNVRDIYLKIKNGENTKEEIKSLIDNLRDYTDYLVSMKQGALTPDTQVSEEEYNELAKHLYWNFVKESM